MSWWILTYMEFVLLYIVKPEIGVMILVMIMIMVPRLWVSFVESSIEGYGSLQAQYEASNCYIDS